MKEYLTPSIEIIYYDLVDIVTASDPDAGDFKPEWLQGVPGI